MHKCVREEGQLLESVGPKLKLDLVEKVPPRPKLADVGEDEDEEEEARTAVDSGEGEDGRCKLQYHCARAVPHFAQ